MRRQIIGLMPNSTTFSLYMKGSEESDIELSYRVVFLISPKIFRSQIQPATIARFGVGIAAGGVQRCMSQSLLHQLESEKFWMLGLDWVHVRD